MSHWLKHPALTAERKKIGVAMALLMLGLLLWGRLLLKDPPRTATADPAARAAAAASPAQINRAVGPRPVVVVHLPKAVERDLFALDETRFEKRANLPGPVAVAPKSTPQPADPNQQAQAAARGLTLQTTMLGDVPRAMINGQLLKVGESVQGFVLIQIQQRHVILQRDDVQVRLEM